MLPVNKKIITLTVKITLATFYGFYILAMILGLFLGSALTGAGRVYNLQATAFNPIQGWSYFQLLSLITLGILVVFFVLSKTPQDLLRREMIFAFASYLILCGFTSLTITMISIRLFRLEFIGIGAVTFGTILLIATIREEKGKSSTPKNNLLKGIGALAYFLGIIISKQNLTDWGQSSPNDVLYTVSRAFGAGDSFYPTLPDWIFGGLVWLFVGLYLTLDYLQEREIITQTRKTKKVLLHLIIGTYTLELLLFSIMFIGFGRMQGVSVILMFIGSMIGIIAAAGIILLVLIEFGFLKTPEQAQDTELAYSDDTKELENNAF